MSKVQLLNVNGEKVKDIKLNDNVFGITPNDIVLHDAIVLSMANSLSLQAKRTVYLPGANPTNEIVVVPEIPAE